ncbi:MAG TPA: hypothetical protein VK968_04580 [Roseimicrobium sp.]|nr:hypothetical protein [Roseimicrobium sp.]
MNGRIHRIITFLCGLLCLITSLEAAEPWRDVLSAMPLATNNVAEINARNFAPLLLGSFQSNGVVKAIILMPGATDEFYFFKQAPVPLASANKTLGDAVMALEKQTRIRATFRPPFLLLHTAQDPLEPLGEVVFQEGADILKQEMFLPSFVWNDRDWVYVSPLLRRKLSAAISPSVEDRVMFHFYRHSMAGYGLTGWEAVEAVSMAGKTTFVVEKGGLFRKTRVTFRVDRRFPNPLPEGRRPGTSATVPPQ